MSGDANLFPSGNDFPGRGDGNAAALRLRVQSRSGQVKQAESREAGIFEQAALQILFLQHSHLGRGHFAAVRL